MTIECLYCVSFQYLFEAKQSLFRITRSGACTLLYCLYRDHWKLYLFILILILCIYHVTIAVFPNCMVQICLVIVLGEYFAMRCL